MAKHHSKHHEEMEEKHHKKKHHEKIEKYMPEAKKSKSGHKSKRGK